MPQKSLTTADFLKRAASVASYYGFTPLGDALDTLPSCEARKHEAPTVHGSDMLSDELNTLVKNCATHDLGKLEKPLQAYHGHAKERTRGRSRAKQTTVRFGLTIFGIEKSIAEALLLQSTLAILDETGGRENICIHINSLGDRDSATKFSRELAAFLRKHIADLPIPAREALKRDPFEALSDLLAREHPLAYESPRPMQFLSEHSRDHLKEILEFLETAEVPYEISNELVGSRDYYSQTLFEIREHADDAEAGEGSAPAALARGGRCDDFARRMFRTKLPAVSTVIVRETNTPAAKSWSPPRLKHPKVYFVQIGARAKLLALSIIELLRRTHIPLEQAIGNDSLTEQLEDAREKQIPYALIMGQREALDGTIIVRDLGTHAQETIPVPELPGHLKALRI